MSKGRAGRSYLASEVRGTAEKSHPHPRPEGGSPELGLAEARVAAGRSHAVQGAVAALAQEGLGAIHAEGQEGQW